VKKSGESHVVYRLVKLKIPKAMIEQDVKFEQNNSIMTVELKGKYWDENMVSEQVWELGKPWWITAKKTIGDRTIISGKLIQKTKSIQP
jgi:hypothetical protein